MKWKNFIENYDIDLTINIDCLIVWMCAETTFLASGPVVDISQGKDKPETGLQRRRASHTWICTQPSGSAAKPGMLRSFVVVLVWDVGHRAQWKESPAYLSWLSTPHSEGAPSNCI